MSSVKTAVRRLGLRRDHLRAARVRGERSLLARLPRHPLADAGRVLCYHSVGTPTWGYNNVSPTRFRHHLELALHHGHRFVAADEIARTGGRPGELAVTFDDGLRSVGECAAPVLAELGIPWLVFVVTDWTTGRDHRFGDIFLGWAELVELTSQGGMVGSHSVSHPNFGRLEPECARQELVDSRREIENQTGLNIDSFAIPFGQSSDWSSRCTEIAREAGYTKIYAQTVGASLPGTVPRTFITGYDDDRIFLAALEGAFDTWEE